MKAIILVILCAPMFLNAQVANDNAQHVDNPIIHNVAREASGIAWAANLNWHQVLKKAKKENKYIFVDCFITRCEPCKKMDSAVYANDSVGILINAKFISVKVQMDSTKLDNEFMLRWHKKAKELGAAYHVAAYPSFFSPLNEKLFTKTLVTKYQINLCRLPRMH